MIVLTFLLVAGFVVQPLFMEKTGSPSVKDTTLDKLNLRKELIYKQIKEAEMEFEMGNLSRKDFDRTRGQLKKEAVRIIGLIQKKDGK